MIKENAGVFITVAAGLLVLFLSVELAIQQKSQPESPQEPTGVEINTLAMQEGETGSIKWRACEYVDSTLLCNTLVITPKHIVHNGNIIRSDAELYEVVMDVFTDLKKHNTND